MISYPDDGDLQKEADRTGLDPAVVVRDIVRIVEALNLGEKGHLGKRNVLAGSMALRCFGSPRFTVYDADFSVGSKEDQEPGKIRKLLEYSDEELDITPEDRAPYSEVNDSGWKFEPVTYDAAFTLLAGASPQFKADFSFRGVIEDGLELELKVPYDLGLWEKPPSVWVMNPHEITAEKILGWCAHRSVKHYADLGFIAVIQRAHAIRLERRKLRAILDAKLDIMRKLHPDQYAAFDSVDDLVSDLAIPPTFQREKWQKLVYVKEHRETFSWDLLVRAVQDELVPLLK